MKDAMKSETDIVVLSACRSPIGTATRGSLAQVDPFDLAATGLRQVVDRSGIDPGRIDDVVMGETLAGGGVIARHAALASGMPAVPGLAVNRHCATGLSAIALAGGAVGSGMVDVVVAGGIESSSFMPASRRRKVGTDEWVDWLSPSHPSGPETPSDDMTITVGWNAARLGGVSRSAMDAWALESHRRAVGSIDAGHFVDEIFPVDVMSRDGIRSTFTVDEHPRRDTSAGKLASLPPLHPEIEGFPITAGNSGGVNDGVALLVLARRSWADREDLEPLGSIRGWASVAVSPERTGLAPIAAVTRLLDRTGVALTDVDLFEINEAFASVAVASSRGLGLPYDVVNTQGSGCSLGHPIAATGARMAVSMLYTLRRQGGGLGVVSMCAGGGMGGAVLVEAEL
jgi:acetyl-CoA acetyltransferase family protein